ncbi:MAG TPA: oleate hydratase [Burkholderiaceae bacterium]|nr:oleate hydratase [Burkholderiaceae bacterium]
MLNVKESQVWLVGGGIASMASAVFLIRDAGMDGSRIHILEELGLAGGSLDGGLAPTQQAAYVTRGGRMLADEPYQTLWNLLSSIPSLEDPTRSARQDIIDFNAMVKTDAHARLIGRGAKILDASNYGLNATDRLELTRLLAMPERLLGAHRIDEMFSDHFFQTNFWQMWRTTFAFQNWHSAIELKRYFLRFIQEFPRMHTLAGVRRTRYNQYDSISVPLQRWLLDKGVDVRFATRVTDVDFDFSGARRRATRLHVRRKAGDAVVDATIELGAQDAVFLTLGSITADATYGSNDSAPELIRDRRDGAWSLWDNVARKAKDFGRPQIFYNVDENKWESFTLTMHGDVLLKRLVEFSRNTPGTGALMTFVDSPWLMSLVVPYQPHFPKMPPDTYTAWGYGLFIDAKGEHVGKPMAQCTGKELLSELIHQLGFEDIRDTAMASTDVTPVMLPYASAMFSPRAVDDRPKVIPDGAENFAFLGQHVELPEDTVYTVEYSVHCAMHAVYRLFGVDKPIPPIYHGIADPKVGMAALKAALH